MGKNNHIQQVGIELQEYFAGQRTNFEVAIHSPGTDFQQEVWHALKKIPFGLTSSYQSLAQKINRPKAIRAVARANGANRIAIILPCHRIIGKNGNLTGYSGGIERKKWLIEFEKKQTANHHNIGH